MTDEARFTESQVVAVARAIEPLFRHGGGGGATGFSLGWNADRQGYGLWDHETNNWFDGQAFPPKISEVDAVGFFARRILASLGDHDGREAA